VLGAVLRSGGVHPVVRVAGPGGGPGAAAASFAAAITSLRELSTPYHLAHGLLDHACYLLRREDADAATAATEEARAVAHTLRCQPLMDRAAHIMSVKSPRRLRTATRNQRYPGRPRLDDRKVVTGVLFVLKSSPRSLTAGI
jgi:hypothetical protein